MRDLLIGAAVGLVACLGGNFLGDGYFSQPQPKTPLGAYQAPPDREQEVGECRAVATQPSAGAQRSLEGTTIPVIGGLIEKKISASGGKWVNRLNALSGAVNDLRQTCSPGMTDPVLKTAEKALIKHIKEEYLKD